MHTQTNLGIRVISSAAALATLTELMLGRGQVPRSAARRGARDVPATVRGCGTPSSSSPASFPSPSSPCVPRSMPRARGVGRVGVVGVCRVRIRVYRIRRVGVVGVCSAGRLMLAGIVVLLGVARGVLL